MDGLTPSLDNKLTCWTPSAHSDFQVGRKTLLSLQILTTDCSKSVCSPNWTLSSWEARTPSHSPLYPQGRQHRAWHWIGFKYVHTEGPTHTWVVTPALRVQIHFCLCDFEPVTPTCMSLAFLICSMGIITVPILECSHEESLKNIRQVLGTVPTQEY